MKLSSNRETSTCTVEHGGLKIVWDIRFLDRTGDRDENLDIFSEINRYFESLDQHRQDALFDVYRKVREVFDEIWEPELLTRSLLPLVKELYDQLPLAEIKYWQDLKSGIIIPSELKRDFSEMPDAIIHRERTYLYHDYTWLVTLSIALRAMVPIWGEFVDRSQRTAGTVWKEYNAFRLLIRSNLIGCEPMVRLRTYVRYTLPEEKPVNAAILSGISSEDFPDWMLGLVVTRRLTVADLRGIVPEQHLAKQVFRFINNKVRNNDANFIGMVKTKFDDNSGGNDETANISRLEGYKPKERISSGDVAMIEIQAQDAFQVAKLIEPDLPESLLTTALTVAERFNNQRIYDQQVQIILWVLSPAVPPASSDWLHKATIVRMTGVALATLWYWGHYEVALLLCAEPYGNGEMASSIGIDSRSRVPKELVERLDKYYPHPRRNERRAEKPKNPALLAIDALDTAFSEMDWRITLPAEWIEAKLSSGTNVGRRYSVPFDIKIKLANFILDLNIKQEKSHA